MYGVFGDTRFYITLKEHEFQNIHRQITNVFNVSVPVMLIKGCSKNLHTFQYYTPLTFMIIKNGI